MQSGNDRFAECRATNISGGAGMIGGPFELVNQQGQTVTDAEVITKPSLLYFGYTFCPDVCPVDVDRNVIAIDILRGQGADIQPVFISIDPARDTPEILDNFTTNMGDGMIGLTGTDEQVRAASRAYRTFFQRHYTEGDDPFYLVDHSTQSYFVLPGYGTVEVYGRDLAPEAMAQSMACFMDKS
jgi:protein SCO1/2